MLRAHFAPHCIRSQRKGGGGGQADALGVQLSASATSEDNFEIAFQALKLTMDNFKVKWSHQLGQYVASSSHRTRRGDVTVAHRRMRRRCRRPLFFFALADLSPCRVRTHVATHSGQYGVVYKAVYVPLNARLAVKVIDLRRPQFSGKALLRLREEIKIMERVQHVRGRAARRVVWAPATLTRACTTVATAGRAMACAAQHYPAACDV